MGALAGVRCEHCTGEVVMSRKILNMLVELVDDMTNGALTEQDRTDKLELIHGCLEHIVEANFPPSKRDLPPFPPDSY